MPSLFVLPAQIPLSTSGGLLAGATLTFSATLTSTPQNVYSDIGLTTPLANPLSADGAGAFVPIYMDPSLPAYRVVLKTLAGAVLKTWDDVPSNQNTSQQFRLKAAAPSLTFEETDASASNKIWRLKVNNEQLLLTILNDAESIETTVFTFTRTGTAPNRLDFAQQYLRVGGLLVATQESGSFTATLTGMTTTVTGTVKWRRSGTKIAFSVPVTIVGTSNTNLMSMTGVPVGLLSVADGGYVPCIVQDNGVNVLGSVSVSSSALIFNVGAIGTFTTSGSKGLPYGWQLIYDTDQSGIA